MSQLLLFLACSDPTQSPGKRTAVADPILADSSGAYHLNLDEAGGEKGAPRGMVFHFPPGAQVQANTGTLSDGVMGFSFGVPEESTAVVCSQPLPLSTSLTVQTRVKVLEIVPGPQKFMGLTIELRSRDAGGNLISPPTGRYTVAGVLREAKSWQDLSFTVSSPPGTVTNEICYRFVRSTGSIEVDSLSAIPGGAVVASTQEVPIEAPVCPEGCCPCQAAPTPEDKGTEPIKATPKAETPKAGLPIKWDLSLAGGKNGAPKGFEFVSAKNNPSTKVSVQGGLLIQTPTPDTATVCSERFSSVARLIIKGTVSVLEYQGAGKSNSAFVVELRSFDAANKLVSPAKVRFQRVFVAQTILEAMDFAKDVSPPDAAVSSRVCARFSEASGKALLSMLAVYPG